MLNFVSSRVNCRRRNKLSEIQKVLLVNETFQCGLQRSSQRINNVHLFCRAVELGEQYCSLRMVQGRWCVGESPRFKWGWGFDVMFMQMRCGAHQGPTCPSCTRTMYVTRRTPHPIYGDTYELQTFECRTCGYEAERSADRSGLPHLSDAAVLAQQTLARDSSRTR